MMDERRKQGNVGEMHAALYLQKKGYTILHQQWRQLPYGEIDIIARRGKELVFVEVKTRRSRAFGYPEEAVTKKKRQKIAGLIDRYLQIHRHRDVAYRFDVIAVEFLDEMPQITHLEAIGLEA
ncbi:MAG: YraN family protein [bacterium]|nr:YraN family protein [bacterium]